MRTYYITQGTLLNALCDLKGKEVQKGGDTWICVADSLCCTPETNTTLEGNYTQIKINFFKKKEKTRTRKILESLNDGKTHFKNSPKSQVLE